MEENENVEQVAEVDSQSQEDDVQVAEPGDESTDSEIKIPKSRFDEVNSERTELKRKLEELRKAEEAREKEALEKKGEFEKLYKEQKSEAEKLKEKLAQMEFDSVRREIATKAGYPALWNRIDGEDADALQADLEALVDAMPGKVGPGIDAATSSGTRSAERPKGRKRTKAERQYLAGVLGVRWENVDEYEDLSLIN